MESNSQYIRAPPSLLKIPVCRQAGWLNAECKLKNAKSPSVKLER